MSLIIFLIIIIVILIIFKDTRSIIYAIGISDIFLRLMHFIAKQLGVANITNFVNKYLPADVLSAICDGQIKITGIFYDVIAWLYIAVMLVFLFNLIKYLIRM